MKDYSFGEFLFKLRKRSGLSQFQLGKLVGVTDKAVSKWERNYAKPKSELLYKLADILEVTVDELMACKYHSSNDEKEKGVFAMKKDIWEKVQKNLKQKYRENHHIEISNRFLSEFSVLKDEEIIIYWDLISEINKLAESKGCYVRSWGTIGSSFVAYLLGATEVNPLRAHYYCPNCHNVEFSNTEYCGWDLEDKKCSCGTTFVKDGHNISFETVSSTLYQGTHFDLCIPKEIADETKRLLLNYFKGNKILYVSSNSIAREKIIVVDKTNSEAVDGSEITLEEQFEKFYKYPSFNILKNSTLDIIKELSSITGFSYKYINFSDKIILEAFKNNNTDNVCDFGSKVLKEMIKTYKPNSFGDLLKLDGLAHATGAFEDNADVLLSKGHKLKDTLAFREDVFDYIRIKCLNKNISDIGIPLKIMEDVRKGIYARKGLPEEIRTLLVNIECEEWFIESIQKIKYLFPKAHSTAIFKESLILMWYKIKFPEKFEEASKKYNKLEKE